MLTVKQLDEDGEGEEMSVARLSMNGVDSSRLAILLRCALFSLCFCSERLLVMTACNSGCHHKQSAQPTRALGIFRI